MGPTVWAGRTYSSPREVMRVILATGSAARYMLPPELGDQQVVCGPDWPDETAADGRIKSLATSVGEYDFSAVVARLPADQKPDAVICLVDASWRNMPRNLESLKCPRVLLVADTHHMKSPIIGMLRYAAAEPFDRIVFLYDRHHLALFHAAGLHNLFWFPGLTFPHSDQVVQMARQSRRVPRIGFVGQVGRFHPRRRRLIEALASHNVTIEHRPLAQKAGLDYYGSSLVGFNASLNGDLNLRVFEILASGAALLTDRLAPESGLAQLFRDGRDILTYGSADELAEVAAYALAHPHETAEVGVSGSVWFDGHLGAVQRRAAFQALALDGREVTGFEVPVADVSRVYFGGDTDRLLQSLLVYEGIQELHREQETVSVALAADAPEEATALCATLPRVQASREPCADETDVAVFGRTSGQVPAARCLWCWDAEPADIGRLQQAFAPHGFVLLSDNVAVFGRSETDKSDNEPIVFDGRHHVLLYTDDPDSGGVAQYNHSLMAGLVAAGYRVSCAQTRCENPLITQQRALGILHYWIPYDTKRDFGRTLEDDVDARKIFSVAKPDLIVFSDCCPLSNFAAREVARQGSLPYVVVVGFVGAYLADRFQQSLGLLAAQYSAAQAVVAVSQENLVLLRQRFGLPAHAGEVIHYGRPEKFFAPRDEAMRGRLRAEIGVPADAVVCFTAARLATVKRYDLQLEAAVQLRAQRRFPAVHFVWAGAGDQRGSLEQDIQRRGLKDRVHLLGHRWDVADWYDAADIFILPSQLEGMPLAIMEAMAKGLPVIATAVSGIPEELGDTGCLLPAASLNRAGLIRLLTETIRSWSNNARLRQQVGEAGRIRALAMFRETRMVGQTVELISAHVGAAAPLVATSA